LPNPLRPVSERLFHDEALSAPDRRPMAETLGDHARRLAGPHGRLVGPFVCPASRLAELDACVASGLPRPPAVAVVGHDAPRVWRGVYATPGLVHVEAPLAAAVPPSPGRVVRYAEIGPHAALDPALDAVAAAGARVKVRASGPATDGPPRLDWLAAVLGGCRARHLAVKVAGGPAHAYTGEAPPAPGGRAGGAQPGIVNLLAAAGAARDRAPAATVAGLLRAGPAEAGTLHARVGGAREVLAAIGTTAPDAALATLGAHDLL